MKKLETLSLDTITERIRCFELVVDFRKETLEGESHEDLLSRLHGLAVCIFEGFESK